MIIKQKFVIFSHGFVHFYNNMDKDQFYNNMKDQDIIGPEGKIFRFGEARPKNDNDEQSVSYSLLLH